MNTAKPITVLLAEDHEIVRSGLRSLLEAEKDIAMPLLNGVEATRQILQAMPGTKILILSAHKEDAYVESAMAAGARGYLLKQTSFHVLIDAIRAVQKGNPYFSPDIARRLKKQRLESLDRKGQPTIKVTHLSSRELEVLQLIAEGKANKQTAAELGISTKTVEKHRDHLMQKLDIHDTASLTLYAISAGIIECTVPLNIDKD